MACFDSHRARTANPPFMAKQQKSAFKAHLADS